MILLFNRHLIKCEQFDHDSITIQSIQLTNFVFNSSIKENKSWKKLSGLNVDLNYTTLIEADI